MRNLRVRAESFYRKPKQGQISLWDYLKPRILTTLRRTVYCGSVGYCILTYVVEPVKTEGPSMQPAIEEGDLILAEHLHSFYDSLQRDDIVALRSPLEPKVLLCKRITAVEGDFVEKFRRWKMDGILPRGHLWVEGDNRENSMDSNAFGPVSKGLIVARLVYRIWPLDRLMCLSNHWFFDRGLSSKKDI